MHILITGAAGFIGSALALRLAERGGRITGLDNLNSYYDVRLKEARLARLTSKPGFEFVRADITDGAAMARLFAGHGAVQVHARHPRRRAAAGLQPRQDDPRLHLHRRHRRGRGARDRPAGASRSAMERRAPRQRALERALAHLQHRQPSAGRADALYRGAGELPRQEGDRRSAADPARRRALDVRRHRRAAGSHRVQAGDDRGDRRAPLRRMVSGVLQMNVAIIGLGYVGLPLAVAFGAVCRTIGFDRDERKIARLRERSDVTGEVNAEQFAAARQLQCTADPAALREADFLIIAVPTPVDVARRPDLTVLLSAVETAGRHMKRGATVVVESTVYPGCTEEDCVAVLAKESDMHWREGVHVGYLPERINPGDKEHRIATNTTDVTCGGS